MYQRELSIRVKPMSAIKIADLAKTVRRLFKIQSPFVDLESLMETLIQMGVVEVCPSDDHRLKGKYALTYPD